MRQPVQMRSFQRYGDAVRLNTRKARHLNVLSKGNIAALSPPVFAELAVPNPLCMFTAYQIMIYIYIHIYI